ncbi:MAG: hypothetical protein LC655_05285 [Bacteroidales bacterium]|nr:hypothetical protein [Bacteroidales bacterium]
MVVTGDRDMEPADHCVPIGRSGRAGVNITLFDEAVPEFGVVCGELTFHGTKVAL